MLYKLGFTLDIPYVRYSFTKLGSCVLGCLPEHYIKLGATLLVVLGSIFFNFLNILLFLKVKLPFVSLIIQGRGTIMFNVHLSLSSSTPILNNSVLQPRGSTCICGGAATAARMKRRGCPCRVRVGGAWCGVSEPKDPRRGHPDWAQRAAGRMADRHPLSPSCGIRAQAGEGAGSWWDRGAAAMADW